jgi:trigger factor
VLDAVAKGADVEGPEAMVDHKVEEMLGSFERSLGAQEIEPEQYYQLASASAEDWDRDSQGHTGARPERLRDRR